MVHEEGVKVPRPVSVSLLFASCMSHCSCRRGCRWVLPRLAEVQAGPALCGHPWAGVMTVWDGGSGSSRCREGRLQDTFLCSFCAITHSLAGAAARIFWSACVLPEEDPCLVVWEWFGCQN